MSATALAARPISEPGFHTAPHGRIERPLHVLRPDYAVAPIEVGFDWAECLDATASGDFYLVVFRSVRRVGADAEMITEFDDLAHAEARLSGGLHFYFKGEPAADRTCLSLCLWDSQEQARAALSLPRHQAAARIGREVYETFRLERYRLTWDESLRRVDFSQV